MRSFYIKALFALSMVVGFVVGTGACKTAPVELDGLRENATAKIQPLSLATRGDAPAAGDCKAQKDARACVECCAKLNPAGNVVGKAAFDKCMKNGGTRPACSKEADEACKADEKCASVAICVKDSCRPAH